MPNINLFINHYQCGDAHRQRELDFCFEANQNNPLIDKIINFDNRIMYHDFFEATKEYPNDINILANSDIYFNETLENVHSIRANECYAITRSELRGSEIVSFEDMHHRNRGAKAMHSQDVWIFRGVVNRVQAKFYLGIPGCDNRVAAEINKAGYHLKNPCYSIQCVHKHQSSERNYNIPKGTPNKIPMPYLWVHPERIELRKSV